MPEPKRNSPRNPAPSARAIQRRRSAPTLARAIAAEERTIQRLIENEGTVEISLSDYRKLVAGLSERGAADAALKSLRLFTASIGAGVGRPSWWTDDDAWKEFVSVDEAARAARQQPALPSGTRHFWIEWNWDENRFSTQADLTEEQAREIETLLEARSQLTQDIGKPEVWEPPTVHATFDEVRKEIVEALGSDTCEACFASLDDNPEHDCPSLRPGHVATGVYPA